MTNKHDRNYNLMEYFLNLLPILELNDMGMEQLLERGAQLSAASLPDATNLWIAHELMQFMDEMPGGFFIYRADGDERSSMPTRLCCAFFSAKVSGIFGRGRTIPSVAWSTLTTWTR